MKDTSNFFSTYICSHWAASQWFSTLETTLRFIIDLKEINDFARCFVNFFFFFFLHMLWPSAFQKSCLNKHNWNKLWSFFNISKWWFISILEFKCWLFYIILKVMYLVITYNKPFFYKGFLCTNCFTPEEAGWKNSSISTYKEFGCTEAKQEHFLDRKMSLKSLR